MRLTTILAAAALLAPSGRAAAQTTTTTRPPSTTTSTTTTTTLLPHPFSAATRACVRKARLELRSCRIGGSDCLGAFNAAFVDCFAAGSAGVRCATTCVTRANACVAGSATARKSCRKGCAVTRKLDVRACRSTTGGDTIWAAADAGCLATASQNFDLCRFNCGQQLLFCRNARRFCIASCANL